MRGMYSRNKIFDTAYLAGAQNLPDLEQDVYEDSAVSTTAFDSYEEYLAEGWADFIRDFCE